MPPTTTLNLEKLFAERNALVRQGKYLRLGRMTVAQTARGMIDFKKQGPVIGKLEAGELVVLSPWEELPVLREGSEEFCPDCLIRCDECEGKGERPCSACAGGGKLRIGGKVDECPTCSGEGKISCGTCRGTGKRPSGVTPLPAKTILSRKPSNVPVPQETIVNVPCSSCQGTLRAGADKPQDWRRFIHGRLGDYIVLAPILFFVIGATGGKGEPAKVFEVLPDGEGNRMCFLFEKPEAGSAVYLLGGILNPLSRAERK